jgi:hypothetical protein
MFYSPCTKYVLHMYFSYVFRKYIQKCINKPSPVPRISVAYKCSIGFYIHRLCRHGTCMYVYKHTILSFPKVVAKSVPTTLFGWSRVFKTFHDWFWGKQSDKMSATVLTGFLFAIRLPDKR